MKRALFTFLPCFLLFNLSSLAQSDSLSGKELDSLFIEEYQEEQGKVKVLHAEPLYIDLIRDLGARKGEKEWNVGLGLTDNLTFDTYEALVEYEFAPIDRLGFEVELPFLIYAPQADISKDSIPSSKMESLKLGTQWTFLVDEKAATSMALGYIHQFEFNNFSNFGDPLFVGNVYNPFLIAAKRWGTNYHTLIYTGPVFEQHFESNSWHSSYEINFSTHYMITGTSNFVGIEFNQTFDNGDFDMTIRPQMRVAIADNFLVGLLFGIPVDRENERFSSFVRFIWEPEGFMHRKKH